MPDFDAIATALAARYTSGSMTAPSPYGPVRFSTASPPNAIDPLPAVLVFPEHGAFEHQGTGTRQGSADFAVQFLFSMGGDTKRDADGLRKWLTILVDQLKTTTQLGLGTYVSSAICTGWTIGKFSYGADDFAGIELTVHVVFTEPWAAT